MKTVFLSIDCQQAISKALVIAMVTWTVSTAQEIPIANGREPEVRVSTVKVDLGPEVELRVLIDYVSKRFGMGILFDDRINGRTVTINAPNEVPVESLLPLLQMALKMKGFALVDADVAGWKQIVTSDELSPAVRTSTTEQSLQQMSPTEPVTHVFRLDNIDSQYASQLIQPFLSASELDALATKSIRQPTTGGSVSSLSQQIAGAQSTNSLTGQGVGRVVAPIGSNLLIVTDYVANLVKVDELLAHADAPPAAVVTERVNVNHRALPGFVEQLNEVLKAEAARENSDAQIAISADAASKRLVLRGPRARIERARSLIQALDSESSAATETYTPQYYSAEKLKDLLGQIMAEHVANASITLAADAQNNRLFVNASPKIQAQVAMIVDKVDKQPTRAQKRTQIYELQNLTALELLSTLRSIQGDDSPRPPSSRPEVATRSESPIAPTVANPTPSTSSPVGGLKSG